MTNECHENVDKKSINFLTLIYLLLEGVICRSIIVKVKLSLNYSIFITLAAVRRWLISNITICKYLE